MNGNIRRNWLLAGLCAGVLIGGAVGYLTGIMTPNKRYYQEGFRQGYEAGRVARVRPAVPIVRDDLSRDYLSIEGPNFVMPLEEFDDSRVENANKGVAE